MALAPDAPDLDFRETKGATLLEAETDCSSERSYSSTRSSSGESEEHACAKQRLEPVPAMPAEMPRARSCNPVDVTHRLKEVLGIGFVSNHALDTTILRALKLLHDVDYDGEDVYATCAHACALARRCPEMVVGPVARGDFQRGAERVVALLALSMMDLDDEACELCTWRSHVVPHMATRRLDSTVLKMFSKFGWSTHVRENEWRTARAELGF